MNVRVLALVVSIASIACAESPERPYRHYASASEAVAAGERERGWLPGWVPGSARDVHLRRDLDTNAWWLRVRLSPPASDSLRALVSPVPADSVRVGRRPWRVGRWWFEALVQHAPENDNALNAELFRGTGTPVPRTVVIAFDRTSDLVFIWGEGSR
jgi:hypothetical protein